MQSFAAGVSGSIFGNSHALMLLVGGILLSVLLGLLLLVLATGRVRALSLVREKTRELSHLALHDPLTGLPNRALVLDRAEQMLARAARNPGTVAGALYIDIDGFKHVNDNLGHAAGDRLLTVAGERLQRAVREQDTVGRLGGDEFVVLVETTPGELTADALADRLTETLREPVELGDAGKLFSVTASIGVASGSYATPDELLRDADLALYAAKAAGKDRYALFDAGLHADAEGRLALQSDLSAAVDDEQLFLHYQPIFDLASRRVVGVEALVRWRHPQRGVVAPASFIPLAEESRLIVPIGRWVLDEACRQAAVWNADGLNLGISVNVSAYQLGRREFAEDVQRRVGALANRALVADARDHRDDARARRSRGVRASAGSQGAGRAHRDRRFRHRLRVAVAPAAHARRHPQDRQELRFGAGRRAAEPRAARGDPRRRAVAVAERGRRGDRAREPADHARRDGLRDGAGLPARPSRTGATRSRRCSSATPGGARSAPPPADAPVLQARPILRRPDLWGGHLQLD